jgi:hypothetical protein
VRAGKAAQEDAAEWGPGGKGLRVAELAAPGRAGKEGGSAAQEDAAEWGLARTAKQ